MDPVTALRTDQTVEWEWLLHRTRQHGSIGAPAENQRHGARQDREVEPQGPMAHIVTVERHPLSVTGVVPPGHLPEAGEPRAYPSVEEEVLAVPRDFIRDDGSRTGETHVAPQ